MLRQSYSTLAAWVSVMVISTIGWGQQQATTQPSASPQQQAQQEQQQQPPAQQQSPGGFAPGRGPMGMMTPARMWIIQWNGAVGSWTRSNMPSLAKLIDDSAGQRKIRLIAMASNRMKNLESAANMKNALLVERIHKNLQLEDAAFASVYEYNHADPLQRADLRKTIRDKVGEIVDANLQQREAQLARLRANLVEEEKKLAADKDRRDMLVSNRMQNMVLDVPNPGPQPTPPAPDVNASEPAKKN